jgi:plastocyanin
MAALAGLVLVLPAPAPAVAAATQQVAVTLSDFAIAPAQLTVRRGQPVQFTVTNAGRMIHNLRFELDRQGIHQTLLAADLRPGQTGSATFTFPVAGEWEMDCPAGDHEALGMKGSVLVLADDAPPAPSRMPQAGGGALARGRPLAAAFLLALTGLGLLTRRLRWRR